MWLSVAENATATAETAAHDVWQFVQRAAQTDSMTQQLNVGWEAWVIFCVVFVILLILDNCVIHSEFKVLSFSHAVGMTLFWVLTAIAFNVYIFFAWGTDAALLWSSGYVLEWLLSMDNLFVFHMIFNAYKTPDELKHKPLFWGICGAVFFRLIFLCLGEYLLHSMMFAHILFGGFLVYTGIQSALADEEDDDPSQNWLVQFLSRRMPFVSYYDAKGAFFVKVPVEGGEPLLANAN